MAMVRPPKNIQWWWSPQKPLKIYNGLFKTIEFYNGFLKKNGRRRKTTQAPVLWKWSLVNIFLAKINVGRHFLSGVEFYTEMMQGVYRFWSISYGLWIFIYVFCSKLVFWRKLILRTFKVQLYIQTIVNLKTIVDHCPQNFENHRKTIDTNGWALKKHSMVMVQRCQNHRKTIEVNGGLKKNINHSIALKNWPSSWSNHGS